jgi:hypothetical protein
MDNEKRGIRELFGFITILLPLLMIPIIVFGGEPDKKPQRNSESQADYVLSVKEGLVSLKAKGAPFKEILEEIGRRMNIEVVADVPKDEKITIEFDMMYLGDAIKRFKTSYAYITNTEKEKGKITKIVVVPKGLGEVPANKFEYNTQPSIQTVEVKGEGRLIGPEIRERKEAGTGEASRPEPFESERVPTSIQTDEVEEEEGLVEREITGSKGVGTGEASRPEPFEFGHDPQPSIQRDEVEEEERLLEREIRESRGPGTGQPSGSEAFQFEYNPQPSIQDSEVGQEERLLEREMRESRGAGTGESLDSEGFQPEYNPQPSIQEEE